jgi:hypothetical protein
MLTRLKSSMACVLPLVFASAAVVVSDLKPEELIKRHLESVGTPAARAAAQSRLVQGVATYKMLVGGSGQIHGKAVIVSEGRKIHVLLKTNTVEYRGEQFICDGEKTSVAGTYADKTRSDLGRFLRSQDVMLREGFFGGTLSTAWPLLNEESWKGRVSYEGIQKVDGRELHALRYRPRESSDVDIALYFDPETFRHVMTIYKAKIGAGIAPGGELSSANRQETRYRIEERFSDFHSVDGLTMPSKYELRFTQELANGFTKSVEWDVEVSQIQNNVPLDPRNFEFK